MGNIIFSLALCLRNSSLKIRNFLYHKTLLTVANAAAACFSKSKRSPVLSLRAKSKRLTLIPYPIEAYRPFYACKIY